MARVPSKHGRDHPLDLEVLNNLQEWELSIKDKDKKLKSQSPGKKLTDNANIAKFSAGQSREQNGERLQKIGIAGEDRRQYDYLRKFDEITHLSSGFMTQESSVDANSEKELGNEYFKQKKFSEAIDCYSRSIALSPTAIAYANRGMAYLKIRRFQEAEEDCTEALNLDDRYIKAYTRRSTARKELGKLKESIEDAEFALRLEPHNQEVKKLCSELKSLYAKGILKKASGSIGNPVQRVQKAKKSELEKNGQARAIQSIKSISPKTRGAGIHEDRTKDSDGQVPVGASMEIEKDVTQKFAIEVAKRNHGAGKQEIKASVQQIAARAASLAIAEAAKNITAPKSAYEFEVSWRGLSSDRTLQARILKATSPTALTQIFKNALSAPLLIDIIRCLGTFFSEDMGLTVRYLENLTKVARFDMIIMCLSSIDKADLVKIWDEVFCDKGTPEEYTEILGSLRSRYCPQL